MHCLRFLCLLSLSSCGTIPSVPICRERTVNSGFCSWTIESKSQIVDDTHLLNGKTWIDIKIDSILVPVDSWVKIKEYIIAQCKRNGNCSDNVGQWQTKVDSLNP